MGRMAKKTLKKDVANEDRRFMSSALYFNKHGQFAKFSAVLSFRQSGSQLGDSLWLDILNSDCLPRVPQKWTPLVDTPLVRGTMMVYRRGYSCLGYYLRTGYDQYSDEYRIVRANPVEGLCPDDWILIAVCTRIEYCTVQV